MKDRDHDEAMAELFRGDPAFAAEYLNAVLEDGVSLGPFVVVESGARIGARSVLRAHVVVGRGATLGPDCLLHARVSIRERVVIGARCIIQDGAVVGSDGFGFAHRDDGPPRERPVHPPARCCRR